MLFNHLMEHKIVAYSLLINGIYRLPLTLKRKSVELNTVNQLAQLNGFPINFITHLNTIIKKPPYISDHDEYRSRNTWIMFTHPSPLVRKITYIQKRQFKNSTYIF
jgi:hypothetical protein